MKITINGSEAVIEQKQSVKHGSNHSVWNAQIPGEPGKAALACGIGVTQFQAVQQLIGYYVWNLLNNPQAKGTKINIELEK